jgi:hypothetical protein
MAEILGQLDSGNRYSLSDKGRFGRWVADRVGGLESLAEFLTDPVGQVLLDEFRRPPMGATRFKGGQKAFVTLSQMGEAIKAARREGRLRRRVRGSKSEDDMARMWLDEWTGQGIVEAGIQVRCRECLATEFLRLNQFTQTFSCPRCGITERTPAVPNFGYALAQVAHLFISSHSDITALALAALERRAPGGFTYDFEHRLVDREGKGRELDLFAVLSGRLFIGEAKKDSGFEEKEFALLKTTALRLRAAGVVLATDRQCDGGCGDGCFPRTPESVAISHSRDLALPDGAGSPRARMERLRSDLATKGCSVIVLCRRLLFGPYKENDFWLT